ncbi:cytochrome b/b6 domain-containing protein [Streptomyces sp. R11]|uniref:Cytochrome b/b6 domain-containing protein n=1 Tax=Streptomyces sp. R11 TaxID=3238625 RepID=A0AB39NA39_9ACTN
MDDSGRGRGHGRRRGEGSGHGRGRGGDGEDGYDSFGDDALLTVHVVLGATVLLLAAARLAWRLATPLPPWAPTLTVRGRSLAHGTETALYVATFAVPVTGLALLLSGGEDLLGVHVAAQIVLCAALACTPDWC